MYDVTTDLTGTWRLPQMCPIHVEGTGYGCLVAITPNWSPVGELGSSQEGETKDSAAGLQSQWGRAAFCPTLDQLRGTSAMEAPA